MLTWRGINNALHGKGTCDLFVGQLELREYLFAKVIPFLEAVIRISFNWLIMNQRLPLPTFALSYLL